MLHLEKSGGSWERKDGRGFVIRRDNEICERLDETKEWAEAVWHLLRHWAGIAWSWRFYIDLILDKCQ